MKNEGDKPRYVMITGFCTLNTGQVPPVSTGGELPDMVLYNSGVTDPGPFSATIQPGGSVRHDLPLPRVSHCMDQTNAPPGQHTRHPVSLIDKGPADAVHMRLNIHEVGVAGGPPARIRVACRW